MNDGVQLLGMIKVSDIIDVEFDTSAIVLILSIITASRTENMNQHAWKRYLLESGFSILRSKVLNG